MSEFTSYFLGIVFLLANSPVRGFLTGAPYSTCWTRYPKHEGLATQSASSPFLVTLAPQTYSPGAEIKVTIQDPNKRWFSGIQIGAFRDTGNREEIVGQFVRYPENKLKVMTCFGGFRNMVTHKNDLKVQSLELIWKAPNENVGNLTFRATVVANFETFWTNVEAKLPTASQDEVLVKASRHKAITSGHMIKDADFSDCGDSKGCFLYPRHCSSSDCLAAVSFQYQPTTDDYLFEMYTTAENWISLGFSDDLLMGHDQTVSCVSNSGQVSVQHGWNPHYHNERLLTQFLSEAEIRHSDGRLQCRFVLPKQTSVYHVNQESNVPNYTYSTYDGDQAWYLMLAWGRAMPASDVMTIHKEMPAVTFSKVYLKDARIFTGSAFPVLVQVHVAAMTIAWIFLSGIVTVVSRHYRDWMPRTRLFGTKIWFQVHRELAILIAVLTATGLFVIFLHYGLEIRKYATSHAYVGLTVMTAMNIQVIAGFLRPGPDHKLRAVFNWGHRLLGQAVHILAAVTMFLAYDIDYITKDLRTFGFTILSIWITIQILWHIVLEILSCKGMPLHANKTSSDDDKSNDKCNLHTILITIYALILFGLFVTAFLPFLLF